MFCKVVSIGHTCFYDISISRRRHYADVMELQRKLKQNRTMVYCGSNIKLSLCMTYSASFQTLKGKKRICIHISCRSTHVQDVEIYCPSVITFAVLWGKLYYQ